MIILKAVTKKYGSAIAVDQISLHVAKGEFFTLVGPNGAGKTTVVRMIMGFSLPTDGTITINGIPAYKVLARAGIGYLGEQHRSSSYLSGRKYLERSAALLGLSGNQAQAEIDRVLEICGMADHAKGRAGGYSKGMQQRIGLAAAILNDPELLVLDEPTSGLDPLGIKKMREVLDIMHQGGTTIVMNSHFLSEVEKLSDTVAFIDHGKMLIKDDLSNIIRSRDQTLEDVFIRYVGKENE